MASSRRLVGGLCLVVFGMFGFGFALVPLYQVFCDLTGLNGKTSNIVNAQAQSSQGVDLERIVTVEFVTYISKGMQWQLTPKVEQLKVNPGQMYEMEFIATNLSSKDQVGQAVPSVSPGQGANYLNKTECFCFNQQPLAAGETATLPLRFFVDTELPQDISTLTLSYTLYELPQPQQKG
ncbi:cytochrome c oxidase assembly protein [Motilimonas sp. 1_MG-2023]|uniref:cytochrome c oxidase assembly protein n=1 Tax=Motilimonas sp. 1_MG-2023 TaxID=3062672 RepID=UPI0026E4122D|nr:cytochrome c oxidase assembly protein [Motilimonas sp. 1_MG-2023]MDO6524776.1 cytochrome c oxidase assembly protein [Motilimonas sp. 1_MG-2023]